MAHIWQIFLSSTAKDLQPYRDAVAEALRRVDDCKVIRMEDFGARANPTLQVCQNAVQDCDLFVGILGHCYGSSPPGSVKSYTEHEFEASITKGMPRLMYVANDEVLIPAGLMRAEGSDRLSRQDSFRQRVGRVSSAEHGEIMDHIVERFADAQDLSKMVVIGVTNWIRDHAAEPLPPVAPQSALRPSRGPYLHKCCNRERHTGRFGHWFKNIHKESPGRPQIYLLHGPEDASPSSLVERLWRTTLTKHFGKLPLKRTISAPAIDSQDRLDDLVLKVLEVMEEESSPSGRQQAAQGVPVTLGPASQDPLAVYVHQCATMSVLAREPAIVLEHNVRGAWDTASVAFLESYFRFWDLLAAHPPHCQFILFFNMLHPPPPPPVRQRWWHALGRAPAPAIEWSAQIEKDLMALQNRRQAQSEATPTLCPILRLPPLGGVTLREFRDFLDLHGIGEVKERMSHCDRLYGPSASLPIADLEIALKSIVHLEFQ